MAVREATWVWAQRLGFYYAGSKTWSKAKTTQGLASNTTQCVQAMSWGDGCNCWAVDETHTGGEPRMLCLVEVMLERSVWRGRGAVPSRARPWIAVEAAQRRGSVAGAGGARTSRSSVKTSVHVSTKAEAGAAVVIRPGRKGRWKGGPAVH
ncbi:hypothetical protein COCVIDRAFT_16542 [Bipolaris victoriae FI3]|uniref:Uncharacterized protein n=1 Tax=Bipolaris victoriae (strain FI3) TaxID=930091 RepID=W7EDN7_BIPV3|nr:hypothetical protein COCVIDRAFT_16542 [Bipolaris victoriae FI3]